jgi:PBP1b-binding outer membrane lipoprotein LpoB
MNTVCRTRQPHDWWNTVALGAVVVITFLMIWLSACSSVSPGTAKTNKAAAQATSSQVATPASASAAVITEERVPTSLSNAGEYGENVYDYAKANDWKNADIRLAALRDAVKQVRTDVNNKSAAVDLLDGNVAALDRAVTARDRQPAMREANQVTLGVADMTTAYKLSVPVEVTRLDYYGRELEVWAQAKDANKLQATAREMRQTWESLRPSVEAHSATEAKKFDALVAQVESAKTPAGYARVATLVLDEVDNLEKLFDV